MGVRGGNSFGRRQLGNPPISVSLSPRYLRQRLVAERERRALRDRKWRRRVWAAGILVALYLLVGRDVIGMVVGLGRVGVTSIRLEAHRAAVALKKILLAKQRDRELVLDAPGQMQAEERALSDALAAAEGSATEAGQGMDDLPE